ncbi:MAG: BrnT family toxin [Rhizobiaceae bacterium]
MEFESFDWDDDNWRKCGKHGLTREDIEALFLRTISILPAPERRKGEERLLAIGKLGDGRSVLVVFTFRIRNDTKLLRPISARYLHEKERLHHEKQIAQAQKNPNIRNR